MNNFQDETKLISRSSFFDEAWYCDKYKDVKTLNISPVEHFLKYGWRLGRDPGPLFSTTRYLSDYPDVQELGYNPLCHYLSVGVAEGRKIKKSELEEPFDFVTEVEYKQNFDFASDRSKKTSSLSFKDSVFVGIASIPQRVNALKETIASIEDQVDKIGVFLDKYSEVPEFLLKNPKVTCKLSSEFDNDVGDAGKFFWVNQHDGFYFTCDDDLIYPVDYVERIKNKIIESMEPVVFGWHGSLILKPFNNYYDKNSRRVFSFGAPRPYDTPVHVLGTGCLGFHTSHIDVRFEDFSTPNMADIYFALLGQQQQVPFVVIEHMKNEIKESDNSQDFSIYKHSSQEVKGSRHNTKKRQNEIVSSTNWKKFYLKRFLKILVIGRFEINEKGGVYKSSHLLEKALKKLGHDVTVCCLSKLDSIDLSKKYDFCIAYAPDPNRPDFGSCIEAVESLAKEKCICAVNFSFNLNDERTQWISENLVNLNKSFAKPRIFFASFSNSTQYLFKDNLREFIVPFPKTISLDRGENLTYEEREGIFLGDLAKLSNKSLVRGELAKWVEQIRIKLPHVNIYALKHYHTEKLPLNYLKIIPYTQNIGEVINKFRLAVCLVPGATFEMVPLESFISGTPVVHREMPQSLSEYLSPVSTEVNSPEELGEVCKNIYERKEVWERLNKSSYSASSYFDFENVVATMDIAIRKTMTRAGIT